MDLKADMDNNNGPIASRQTFHQYQNSAEEREMLKVLNIRMNDLKYVYHEIHEICLFLSISENLEEFLSECGYSLNQRMVCDAMMKNQPLKLPAKSFLEMYFRDACITLRKFMQILLRMEDRQCRIHPLLLALWNAALFGNSRYFRNLYGSSSS